MKIRTKTSIEAAKQRETWAKTFALFPVKVGDGDWRWLETIEFREMSAAHGSRIIQHRAPGADRFWPPYPFNAGEFGGRKNRDRS